MATKTKTTTRTLTATGTLTERMKGWQPKIMGAKPTADQVTTAAAALRRHGTGKHLALAMYLRPNGATQGEVVLACHDTNINAYYDAVRGGQFEPVTLPNRGGHKVYALVLPKAKPARKPRKAKAAKATPATSAPDGGNA